MELKTPDNKYIISKEEYDFLTEVKQLIHGLRNNWFSEGRRIDRLVKKLEKIKSG